ncbi:hypothetical protein J4G33_13475 [Actinotalea sp. BY-33]|uniref:Uncharacterized protein n=1 Tax=Actinotalea soli TaxID=2819234 RepID=A0A939LRP4_9CELL|nr:hypothetical protein [Actinotalea soli]MBO1752818.1 hypothetical protein [Actinotalea soli]
MARHERLVLPRLTTRSALAWGIGTLVVLTAVLAYLGVTDPSTRPWIPWAVGVVALVVVWVVVSRVTLDPGHGSVTWRRLPRSTRVELAQATTVAITPSGPSALLTLRTGRRGGSLMLVVVSDYVERSQSAEVLLALADALETHTSTRVRGSVPGELRKQAKHLTAGGSVKASPLAARTSTGLTRAAGGVGAAGGGLGQL